MFVYVAAFEQNQPWHIHEYMATASNDLMLAEPSRRPLGRSICRQHLPCCPHPSQSTRAVRMRHGRSRTQAPVASWTAQAMLGAQCASSCHAAHACRKQRGCNGPQQQAPAALRGCTSYAGHSSMPKLSFGFQVHRIIVMGVLRSAANTALEVLFARVVRVKPCN